MAVDTPTVLAEGASTADSATYNTASIAPTANSLVLVSVRSGRTDGTAAAPTGISGAGMTWVQVGPSVASANNNLVATLWRGLSATPGSGALTITHAGVQHNCTWHVVQVGNVDTSGTNGSGAIVQSDVSNATPTSVTFSLPNAVGADNATFAFLTVNSNTGSWTPGSGYTRLGTDQSVSGPTTEAMVQYDLTGTPTITATSGSGSGKAMIAVEVADATGASPQTISPDVVASTATVPGPTVTPGAVTIAAALIASTLAIPSPAVAPGPVSLSPARIESTAAVHQPSVSSGAGSIAPPRIESTATVAEPTVTPGPVAIAPGFIASTATAPSPTVAPGPVTVAPAVIASTASVPAPTIGSAVEARDISLTVAATTEAWDVTDPTVAWVAAEATGNTTTGGEPTGNTTTGGEPTGSPTKAAEPTLSLWSATQPYTEAGQTVAVTIPAVSKEYLHVPVTASVPLDTQTVELAFLTSGTPGGGTTWIAAAWEGNVGTTRSARLLIGPGAEVLAVGTYTVWVRVTDVTEIPVRSAGQVIIT